MSFALALTRMEDRNKYRNPLSAAKAEATFYKCVFFASNAAWIVFSISVIVNVLGGSR